MYVCELVCVLVCVVCVLSLGLGGWWGQGQSTFHHIQSPSTNIGTGATLEPGFTIVDMFTTQRD